MSDVKKRLLTVDEWHELAQKGADIPVTTLLYGTSMEPLIRYKKDLVTVIPRKRPLRVGDIVLFKRQDGAFVAHRVYRLSEDGAFVQTFGDNCFSPDRPIRVEDVVGLIVSMEKRGKKIPLDTDEQRAYGVKWMNRSWKRRVWFFRRRVRTALYRVYVATGLRTLKKKFTA